MTRNLQPALLRHGQRVRPEYEAPEGEATGAWGHSTDAERPLSKVTGRLARFRKHQSVSKRPQALGWIKARYRDAIEYTGLRPEMEGAMFVFGVFLTFGGVFFLYVGWFAFGLSPHWFDRVLGLAVMSVGLSFFVYWLVTTLRLTCGQPADLPIIFDRKHRKVYRMLHDVQPGFKGRFLPWPIQIVEYEWDLLDVEHEAALYNTGNTVLRNHHLYFVVRKSADDPTIIDSFQIANPTSLSEDLVPAMWEHIRRFMEEGGPHLPHSTEPLAFRHNPRSWWEACGAVGVFGSRYFWWWREQLLLSLIAHIFFPFTLPLNLLQGLGLYLKCRTEVKVEWPEEVKQRLGPALQRGAGWG